MNAERLLRLTDHLETVVSAAPERFNMGMWAESRSCGTVCCAMGHACFLPEFRAAGLELTAADGGEPRLPNDGGGYVYGFEAATEFFGIALDDATELFAPDAYAEDEDKITPADVAARIRELVARYTA